MSSVANNHGAFAQQSLISPQKSPSTGAQQHPSVPHPLHQPPTPGGSAGGGVPMSFYNKRDECYSVVDPVMRTRQSDYASWTTLSTVPTSVWSDVPPQPTNPPPQTANNPETLPPAHNLLNTPEKDGNIPTSTVVTNQNGKTFAAPTTSAAAYPRYDQHQQAGYPQQYPPKRGASFSGQRPTYVDGSMALGVPSLDYVEGRCDQNTGFQPPPLHLADPHFSSYRYGSTDNKVAGLPVNGLTRLKSVGASGVRPSPYTGLHHQQHSGATDSTGCESPHGSVVSSDGETTTSSRGGGTGSGSIHLGGGGGNTLGGQQQKRPRKPAPTLATGRRNLKCEPVDPDEADRRMKRRERNRKSAQKCRERKLYRTQELQAQVESLNMEASRLLREVEGWREHARRCVELLRQHCPGVTVPYANCLIETVAEGYLQPPSVSASTPTTTPHTNSLEAESMAFCDDVGFYSKSEISVGGGYPGMMTATVASTTTAPTVGGVPNTAGLVGGTSSVWGGRAFSPVSSQLPPMSHLIPTSPSASVAKAPVLVKTEPQSTANYWKNDGNIDSFLSEVHQEDRDIEWKTENDTDSSPGCGVAQLHTPNTNDGDKTSNLSSSL